MAKMDPIEKLARDLCWAGFAGPKPKGTKAQYWESVAPEAKARYLEDAKLIRWALGKLGPERIQRAS